MHPNKPSQTAARVALARAIEARLPAKRRICSDHYAGYFLEGSMKRIYDSWLRRKLYAINGDRRMPGVIAAVMARTRFIDDLLCQKIKAGINQVVIFGAGYDTRAFRFQDQLKNITVFEIDHPATQQRKTTVIQSIIGSQPSNVTYVPIRFNRQDLGQKLSAAGYRETTSALFIWEGVTYYLSSKAVEDTLRFVAGHSLAGSSIVFDYFPPSVADGTCHLKEVVAMRRQFAQFGETFSFGIEPAKIHTFLSTRGFGCIRNLTPAEIKKRYATAGYRRRKISAVFHFVSAETTNI